MEQTINLDSEVIKPINRDTVHRICSGQVVLSLAIAVKELVENSIDAESTIIDIRLKEYGADLIEVSDNGIGVHKDNFQALTLKHYTSKIREFNDLQKIGTLGFRGEALSSLCALSDLSIVTKHKTTGLAAKICYNRNGKIVSETPIAREQGTTVCLENIFFTLPVRRKEFLKNLKREFSKMCQLLYAYCLVSKGIKFTCTNTTNKGSKSAVLATQGQKTVRENIINIFGARQISSLINVDLVLPDEAILNEYTLQTSIDEVPFKFEFFISSVVHGSGRSACDRQFYYINSRPCEPTKLIKLVNEVYRQFNNNQYPFVYLNVITESSLVDVNVTPDKRQVFLEKEKVLLATVKMSLLDVFKSFPSTYKLQNLDLTQSFLKSSEEKSERGIKRSLTDGCCKNKTNLVNTLKKSKSDDSNSNKSFDISQFVFNKNKVKKEDKDAAEDKLSELIKIACKYSNEENDEENILDIEDENIEETNSVLDEDVTITTDNLIPERKNTAKQTVNITVEDIKNKLLRTKLEHNEKQIKVRFRSEIRPDTNKDAENELNKQIMKEDFKKMEIIGQFNLGFIIAKLNNDLFIIDQHASDEKYNFEQLQATTVLEHQVLVNPKQLELTAGNEAILIENLNIFEKNGFSFSIIAEAPSTKKILMTAIPISKNFVFGKDDIDEMLFMLQDGNCTMCRPTRVRAMFASRACRKSIMIGKSLSLSDMRKLIDHMGEIDQPWNCPHGRPTMRHLINLDLIENESLF